MLLRICQCGYADTLFLFRRRRTIGLRRGRANTSSLPNRGTLVLTLITWTGLFAYGTCDRIGLGIMQPWPSNLRMSASRRATWNDDDLVWNTITWSLVRASDADGLGPRCGHRLPGRVAVPIRDVVAQLTHNRVPRGQWSRDHRRSTPRQGLARAARTGQEALVSSVEKCRKSRRLLCGCGHSAIIQPSKSLKASLGRTPPCRGNRFWLRCSWGLSRWGPAALPAHTTLRHPKTSLPTRFSRTSLKRSRITSRSRTPSSRSGCASRRRTSTSARVTSRSAVVGRCSRARPTRSSTTSALSPRRRSSTRRALSSTASSRRRRLPSRAQPLAPVGGGRVRRPHESR